MWCWLLRWKYINTFLNVKVHVKPWALILSFTKYHIFYHTCFSSVLYWDRIPGTLFRISVAIIFCYLGLPKMCTGVLLESLLLSGVDMTGTDGSMGEVTHLFSLLPSIQSDFAPLSGLCLKQRNFGGGFHCFPLPWHQGWVIWMLCAGGICVKHF